MLSIDSKRVFDTPFEEKLVPRSASDTLLIECMAKVAESQQVPKMPVLREQEGIPQAASQLEATEKAKGEGRGRNMPQRVTSRPKPPTQRRFTPRNRASPAPESVQNNASSIRFDNGFET